MNLMAELIRNSIELAAKSAVMVLRGLALAVFGRCMAASWPKVKSILVDPLLFLGFTLGGRFENVKSGRAPHQGACCAEVHRLLRKTT